MTRDGFTLIEVLISLTIVGCAVFAISTQYASLDRMVSESDISLQARNLISQKISAIVNGEESFPDVRSSGINRPLTYVQCFTPMTAPLANQINQSIQPILVDLGNDEKRLRSLAQVGSSDLNGRVCPEVRGYEMHLTYAVDAIGTVPSKRIRIHVIPTYLAGTKDGTARSMVQTFEDVASIQDAL